MQALQTKIVIKIHLFARLLLCRPRLQQQKNGNDVAVVQQPTPTVEMGVRKQSIFRVVMYELGGSFVDIQQVQKAIQYASNVDTLLALRSKGKKKKKSLKRKRNGLDNLLQTIFPEVSMKRVVSQSAKFEFKI